MLQFYLKLTVLSVAVLIFGAQRTEGQNSLLIDLGSNTCADPYSPTLGIHKNPLGTTPSILTNCDLENQLDNFYESSVTYNPSSNKIYLVSRKTENSTKIWVLDIGLPGNITCPVIPAIPTYTIPYNTNNFEFDRNGNIWSLSNYSTSTRKATLTKADVSTGNVIFSKTINFPGSNYPNSITSGDLVILPNGRFFATLGRDNSRLFEITNYEEETGNAVATYLKTLPYNTFGIAFVNGLLQISGTDSYSSCYYYTYNISTNTLSSGKQYQNNRSPIDNSSLNPAVGVAKQLYSATSLSQDSSSFLLTYEITVKNTGNTTINNINVIDNLADAFGAENISDISASFVDGYNSGNLILNQDYNGSTITNLLLSGQNLPNQSLNSNNYLFKILLSFKVQNIDKETTYLNSAISQGYVGDINNTLNFINVSDSSNNGDIGAIDPNNNANASEPEENTPTPFSIKILPNNYFVRLFATLSNNKNSIINWTVLTPLTEIKNFQIEYSINGVSWINIGNTIIANSFQGQYTFYHTNIPSGIIYYRIKAYDYSGGYTVSKIISLKNKQDGTFKVFPNPANDYIKILIPNGYNGKAIIKIFDFTGRKIIEEVFNNNAEINTKKLPEGTYLLSIFDGKQLSTQKIIITH